MPNLLDRVEEFLTAYSANDLGRVMQLVSPEEIVLYDDATVGFSPTTVIRQLEQHFQGGDVVRFEYLRHLSIQTSTNLATAFFDATFRTDTSAQTWILRFATVWSNVGGSWYLTQTLTTVLASHDFNE